MSRRPSTQTSAGEVQKYVGTSYDIVHEVYKHLDTIEYLVQGLEVSYKYLGASDKPPVARLNGDPIEDGDFYLNTLDDALHYWDETEQLWIFVDPTNMEFWYNEVKRLHEEVVNLHGSVQQASFITQENADKAENSAQKAKASEDAALASENAAASSEANAKTSETTSKTSETNAKASEVAAKDSQDKAKVSELAAKASEVSASGSASAAKQSETIALDKARESAASAQIATDKANLATTKAQEASDSADASAASEADAENAAIRAGQSANNAATSEQNAANSASAAKISEDTALVHRNAAKVSETNASNSASTASTAASNAKASETSANTAMKAAQASEAAATNAKTSAVAANASAQAAKNSAEASAQVATDKAAIATTKATEASQSASNAASSASNALASKNAAKASQDSANASEVECRKIYDAIKDGMTYGGTWNAKTNAYPAKPSVSTRWDVVVEGGGNHSFDGKDWKTGDTLYYESNADKFYQRVGEAAVTSVNGEIGAVQVTPDKIGAVKKSGDTMTGTLNVPLLKITSAIQGILNSGNSNLIRAGGSGQATIVGNYNEPTYLDAKSAEELYVRSSSSTLFRVYHEGHKPTPAEVGSYSKAEADGLFPTKTSMNTALALKLDKTAKAADSSKLNGYSDYYSPRAKPTAADVGTYSKAQIDTLIASAGKVDSVNGKTGAVTLNAGEVGAYSKSESDNKYDLRNRRSLGQVDLNTVKQEGRYYGYQWTSAPSNTIAVLDVDVYSPDWLVQRFTVINKDNAVYVRSWYSANTWSPWRRVFDEAHPPTAAEVGALTKAQADGYYMTPAKVGIPSDGSYLAAANTTTNASVDLDTLTKAGFYSKLFNNTSPNMPSGSGYGYIQNMTYQGSNMTQIAYPYGTTGNNGKIAFRTRYSNVWQPWEYLYTTKNKPTANDVGTYTKAEIDNKVAAATGKVSSVNGKTGAVTLNADEVGSIPASKTGSGGLNTYMVNHNFQAMTVRSVASNYGTGMSLTGGLKKAIVAPCASSSATPLWDKALEYSFDTNKWSMAGGEVFTKLNKPTARDVTGVLDFGTF